MATTSGLARNCERRFEYSIIALTKASTSYAQMVFFCKFHNPYHTFNGRWNAGVQRLVLDVEAPVLKMRILVNLVQF